MNRGERLWDRLGTRKMGTGLGRGLSSSPQQPSPSHLTDGGGEWRGGAINTSRILKRQRKEVGLGVSERG